MKRNLLLLLMLLPFLCIIASAEHVTSNLLSHKWSGAEYTVQAITYDSGIEYGPGGESSPHYNKIVGIPNADSFGREWFDFDYSCNWQEITAPLNNWCVWPNYGDIYARRTFYYEGELPAELYLACGHDDAPCEYYLNGTLIWSITDGWYEQEIYRLTESQKTLLRPGELNVLAFHVHQNWGLMYADCGLYTSLSNIGITNKCGDHLTWSFDGTTGSLIISGTGEMYDYTTTSAETAAPWSALRSVIKHLIIQLGVTCIGDNSFVYCNNLTDIYCYADDVPNTDSNAFNNSSIGSATLHVPAASLEAYRTTAPWNSFGNVVPIEENANVNIGSTGYATYCPPYDLDFSEVSGVRAYIASGFNPSTGKLVLTRVDEVPAGEGLYLVGDPGTYEIPFTETDMLYANFLKGVTTTTTISPTEGNYTNFILSNGSHGIGFYTLSSAGQLAAGKAYLQLPTSSVQHVKAISVIFEDDDATAIQDIEGYIKAEDIYNLQGQKVNTPRNGLYIINGKKVLFK